MPMRCSAVGRGAFVGTALAGGADPSALLAAQSRPATEESAVSLPRAAFAAWVWASVRGFRNPERIGAAMGAVARRRRPLTDVDQRRRIVQARLNTATWPATLRVTAINAETGRLRVFTRSDGILLLDAVCASSALPGISSPVKIDGGVWIDGGMVSSTNARLARGVDDLVVIASLPRGHGGVPSVRQETELLRGRSTVHLIVPDDASRAAIGPNIYDPGRRGAAAAAGHAQGRTAAELMTESPTSSQSSGAPLAVPMTPRKLTGPCAARKGSHRASVNRR